MPEEYERTAGREIVRHSPKVIATHWAVIIVYIPLSLTALLLLRDWIFAEFNIFGGNLLIETFDGATETHWGFGILLLIIGLAHVLMHAGQEKKPILPKDVGADFRATVQSLKYVTFLSSY
jgi:cytochrome b561